MEHNHDEHIHEEYNPDILTLTDDQGNTNQFELISTIEEGDTKYVALVPVYENPEDLLEDDGEFIILKSVKDGDEEFLEAIEDEDEMDRIADAFEEKLADLYDIIEED